MVEDGIHHLRVLIANERRVRLELLARVVGGLGHEVPPVPESAAAPDAG